MGTSRISRKPDRLANQCALARTAIGSESDWPVSAPSAMTMNTCAENLMNQLSIINGLNAQLRTARQAIKPMIQEAQVAMMKVDQATDLLYGPGGAEKISFGLEPKKTSHTPSGPPDRVVIRAIKDGVQPASIFLDFDAVESAAYDVQWFADAPLTQLVGSATVTSSEIEVPGLICGNQYWFRVRAVRAGNPGPWSDQATRVANI